VSFTLPECTDGNGGCLLVDANIPDEEAGGFAIGEQYGVTARQLLLFELQIETGRTSAETFTHPAPLTPTSVRPRGQQRKETNMGRGILLWLIGVPIPIIILLALIWH
jgi:hypothetical protein